MRVLRHSLFVAIFLAGASPLTVGAQTGATDRPAPEVSIGISKFPTFYGDVITQDLKEPMLDIGVSVPVSPRFAVEGMGTIGRRNSYSIDRTEGLYIVQVKQRLRSLEREGWRPFLTYGFAGYYASSHQPAADVPQPGGIVIHRPAMTYRTVEELAAMLIGGGVQRRLNDHLLIRADAQLQTILWLPLGFRFSAGVSIPIGH